MTNNPVNLPENKIYYIKSRLYWKYYFQKNIFTVHIEIT